ncbi:MAG: pyridoxamine 5'-phosphate oxidase family protein [Leptospira sp.]|nr:pyridoxamine 5'-phosphate oxidase family protein [Leptospira sp.]
MSESVYHRGEIEAQKKAGTIHQAESIAHLFMDQLPVSAVDFFASQSMVILSSQDLQRNIWASIILGKTGFITAVDKENLRIGLSDVIKIENDPLWENIKYNRQLGLLLIDLTSRKRFRVNGTLSIADESIYLKVEQSFPNCPKYIQRRIFQIDQSLTRNSHRKEQGILLTDGIMDWIRNSDTFFVGSANDTNNLDVSHRGGNPGFIEIPDNRTLQIPDYKGNNLFNTLGNFLVNPNAGLLFIDYITGKTLQLTGYVDVLWTHGNENESYIPDRSWKFFVSKWIQTDSFCNIHWDFMDFSPHNPQVKK